MQDWSLEDLLLPARFALGLGLELVLPDHDHRDRLLFRVAVSRGDDVSSADQCSSAVKGDKSSGTRMPESDGCYERIVALFSLLAICVDITERESSHS